jgi:cobalt transporter subunit CbtB
MAQSTIAVASGPVATTALRTALGNVLGLALAALALLSVLILLQGNALELSPKAANYLHEATHDARHALGVPCH